MDTPTPSASPVIPELTLEELTILQHTPSKDLTLQELFGYLAHRLRQEGGILNQYPVVMAVGDSFDAAKGISLCIGGPTIPIQNVVASLVHFCFQKGNEEEGEHLHEALADLLCRRERGDMP